MYESPRPPKRQCLSWTRDAENNNVGEHVNIVGEQHGAGAAGTLPDAHHVLSINQVLLPQQSSTSPTHTTTAQTSSSSPHSFPPPPRILRRDSSAFTRSSLSELLGSSEDVMVSPAATSVQDDLAANPKFQELQEELRSLLVTGAQSSAPTRAATPDDGERDEAQDGGDGGAVVNDGTKAQHLSDRILCTPNRLRYFKNYMNGVAPWLDMFDVKRHFGIDVPLMAHGSPTLLYAMLALSARHVERKHRLRKSSESLELYQDAIRLLTPSLEARDPNILATCVVLCVLEMMSASPHNWRRHLEGCAALFQSYNVNGFSGGLLQAVFWCYTRMDLCAALISDGMDSTVLPIEYWIPHHVSPQEVAGMVAQTKVPDMHANYAVYLCARVCSFLAQHTKAKEFGVDNGCTGNNFLRQWQELWEEVREWRENRPSELVPVSIVNPTKKTLFPSLLFSHWAAISSNQLHHTACILLLAIAPPSAELGPAPFNAALWHARRIVGISKTNLHEGCLNNSLQPLWLAGRLLSHRSEHMAVVNLIRSIEDRTGWGFCWRIKDLEEAWGYDRGELGQPR